MKPDSFPLEVSGEHHPQSDAASAGRKWVMLQEIGKGGRTAAAIGASEFAKVLMVSEGGQISFYQTGHCAWTL